MVKPKTRTDRATKKQRAAAFRPWAPFGWLMLMIGVVKSRRSSHWCGSKLSWSGVSTIFGALVDRSRFQRILPERVFGVLLELP